MNVAAHPGGPVSLELGEDYPDIRAAVAKICEGFPGSYWRKLEDDSAYPTEFVKALTEAGFLGALIDLKYTNVDVSLESPIGNEFVSATAPVPTVGVVGRVYAMPALAINGELTFFRTPGSLAEQLDGNASYTDFDLNGTFNFNKNVGFKMGYRRTSVFYDVEQDTGDLKFKGLYFGGVVRY